MSNRKKFMGMEVDLGVNLGEILTILTMIFALLAFTLSERDDIKAALSDHDTRLSVAEKQIEASKIEMNRQEERSQRQFEEVKDYLIRIDQKIDRQGSDQ